jgi:RHS repeat-associated protein
MVKGPTGYTKGSVTSQTMTVESGTNLSKAGAGVTGISSTYGTMDVPHNHLNLPAKFEFNTANKIELLYDGQGNKLRKTVTENNVVKLTQDYLDGIELKNNVVEAVYNEEGRAFNNAGTYRYEYALRDHLGNTRVVFTDKSANGAGIQDQTEILSETHYYPFGKTMDGAWYNDASAPKYKYLYNGKELTEEFDLNFYDYGARWFDPGMASWWEIDPASEIVGVGALMLMGTTILSGLLTRMEGKAPLTVGSLHRMKLQPDILWLRTISEVGIGMAIKNQKSLIVKVEQPKEYSN